MYFIEMWWESERNEFISYKSIKSTNTKVVKTCRFVTSVVLFAGHGDIKLSDYIKLGTRVTVLDRYGGWMEFYAL